MNELVEDLRWLRPPDAEAFAWWWVAAGGMALLLALLLASHIRRRRRACQPLFAKPAPPHARALRALDALTVGGDDLEFVQRVSAVARQYIQERFGLRAPHRSTEEFLWEAERDPALAADHRELLGIFLRQCDLVKFAKRRVDVEQKRELLDSARRFVLATATSADHEKGGA